MTDASSDRFDSVIADADVPALVITGRTAIRFLTGFDGEYGVLCLGGEAPVYFANSLYIESARTRIASPVEVREYTGDMFAAAALLEGVFQGGRIGFEADDLTCQRRDKLAAAFPDAELVPVTGATGSLRRRKDPDEISAITSAQRIAETVFAEVSGILREGVREREIAAEIDYRMRLSGAERPSFDTIVAFGPHTSMPHAVPGDRRLARGEAVLIDMGAIYDGYASDMTRTIHFGESGPKYNEVYGTVLQSQMAALAGIRAGISCDEADRLARTVIDDAGYGAYFTHSLGHGVGLEVHELPRLAAKADDILEAGMVVTVEPGIYLPGRFGVRIEDLVVVTAGGCENLTHTPKDMMAQ